MPTSGEDGCIKEESGELKGHLQAQEHRSVMQFMPLVLLTAVHEAFMEPTEGKPIVELVMRYAQVRCSASLDKGANLHDAHFLLQLCWPAAS